ncbi:hypothetical protein GBAR_LOCUS17020 [Geodia barretti]|nr:hypothetical protein GBAR_LOCUS17020 [Geodia barretti]
MGEFIPEPGERPLSSYGQPTPSGFDYYPSTAASLPGSPSHALHSRPFPLSQDVTPGPPDYQTRKSSVWRHKTFTLNRKGTTRPYDTRENAHITCSPGAGHYRRVSGDVGSATRRSMSARHRDGVHVGYPNSLIQPVDTLGFATPGPNLWRDSERGAEKTFGPHTQCKTRKKPQKLFVGHGKEKCSTANLLASDPPLDEPGSPGPAAYAIQLPTPKSPGKSIGQKLHIDFDLHYPAPNAYTIPDTVATTPGKTFGIKNDIDTDQHFPPPNTYSIPLPQSVSHFFNYRPFPTSDERRPGPAEYSKTHSDLPRSPDYSCRNKCRPVFPDILLYPEYVPAETPGAGEYEYDREFADNSAPKYSHGLPLPARPNSNPGPNQYRVQHDPTQHSPPSFTMGARFTDHTPQSTGPGPSNYHPKQRPSSAVSITPRRSREKKSCVPGANHYHVPPSLTRRGISSGHMTSLKGRRSIVCYSGFPSSHLSRLASLAL